MAPSAGRSSPPNHCINYYSDFLYCSFGRPYGLVVTAAGAENITKFPYGPAYNIVKS